MAVTKRTRFEVLRRDNYTCRYCGETAPNVKITIDHVMPASLGGSDRPENLVACCRDCNSGKASSSPDSETVENVAEDALRWAAALKQAAREAAERREGDTAVLGAFYDMWHETIGSSSLPPDWETAIRRYLSSGLTMPDLEDSALIALARLSPHSRSHFSYFCGICRNKVEAIAERAREIMESEVVDGA